MNEKMERWGAVRGMVRGREARRTKMKDKTTSCEQAYDMIR